MNFTSLRRTIGACAIIAAAVFLGGCVSTSTTATTGALAPVSSLSAADLKARADTQAQIYAKNPADTKNALQYADTLGAMNRSEQQNAVLEKVVLTTDGDPEAMAAYGKSLIAVGEYARADQVLSQAFAADAPDWKVLSARGVANDKLGNHAVARQLYDQALRIQPNEPSVLTNLGLSHAFERDYGQAEVYLRQAAAQPGADQRTQENLALVQGLQGNRAAEKQTLSKFSSVDAATDTVAAVDQLKLKQETSPMPASSRQSAKPRRAAKTAVIAPDPAPRS